VGELGAAAAEVRPGSTSGATCAEQLRAALRPLLDRPGHAAAVAATLAVASAVSLPASLLLRIESWTPLRLAPGIVASGPGPLDGGVPWGEGAVGPAGLRGEELEGLLILLALLVAAVVVACVLNLAVLLMQHLAGRRRELAIRRALGATRSRLRRDLLLQGAVLAAAGVVAGGVAGALALLALPGLMPAVLEPVGGYAPRPAVAAALAGPALVVVAAGYGLVGPAVAGGTRLGERRRSVTAGLSAALGPARWEKGLAALQCGLLVALLVGSGLLLRGAGGGSDPPAAVRDPGQLRIRDVTLRTLQKGPAPFPGPDSGNAAGLASSGALLGLGTRAAILCRGCRRGGVAAPVMQIRPRIHAVGPRWFEVLGVPVLRGRSAGGGADGGSPAAAAVNRAFAARYGIGVGARLQLPGRRYGDEWTRVAGVVENLQPPGLGSPSTPEPAVYLPALRYRPSRLTLVARAEVDPATALVSLSGAGNGATGTVEVETGEVHRLTGELAKHREPEERLRDASVLLVLLAWGSGLAGLAAVTVLTLRRRWRELGIRRAVGARRRDVLALVLKDNLRTLGVGAAIGAVLVSPESRALGALLPGLRGLEPGLYYAAAVAAVGLTVAATTWLPVRAANRLAPREMMARE